MFEIFKKALGWLIGAAQTKFVAGSVLTFVVSTFVTRITELLTTYVNPQALTDAFNAIPDGMWYFMGIAQFSTGLVLVIGALVTRFLIRRIPIIG